MNERIRFLVALGIGFIVFRLSGEVVGDIVTALVLGLIAGGVTWVLLKAWLDKRKKPRE